MTARLPDRKAAAGALPAVLLVLGLCHTAQAHEGGLGNEVMWKACEAHELNDRCAFENPHHDVYRGTCQSMSSALVCVRNQPIDYAAGSAHASTTATPVHNSGPGEPAERTGHRWPWILGYGVVLLGVSIVLIILGRSKAPKL